MHIFKPDPRYRHRYRYESIMMRPVFGKFVVDCTLMIVPATPGSAVRNVGLATVKLPAPRFVTVVSE